MGEIKAGVVVVTEFCRPNAEQFQGYIDYINRNEAVRNENTEKYNLYQDYMGNPEKTTGLFTADKDTLTKKEKNELKEIFTKAQENESIMWQTVISFDNRWLKQHGIINEEENLIDEGKLKEVARGGVRRMLEAEGLENAVWSGAIHFNTDNLHIHIATVEPVPMREQKEYTQYEYSYENGKRVKTPILDDEGNPVTKMEYKGRFKQSSIEKCKSHVVNELINDKENNIKINNIIRESIVRQKQDHPLSKDADFMNAFEALYQKMPDVNRNLWNYNNPIIASVREQIDAISLMYMEKYHADEFLELQERIKTQEEVYKESYGDSKKDYAAGKMKDLYTRLGNAILKEMKSYDKEVDEFEKNNQDFPGENELEKVTDNNEKANGFDLGVINDPLQNNGMDSDNFTASGEEKTEQQIDDFIEPEVEVESSFYKWSKEYKKAKKLLHQKKPDYEAAIQILLNEHRAGNILATYELGDIYKYGRGKTISAETAEKYYARALAGFEYQLDNPETGNMTPEALDRKVSYLNYRVGKMYYYGMGTETDYDRAFNFFTDAEDNQYAKYMLGKMKYYGQGIEKNWSGAFADFASISKGNAYAAYKAANMIENGEVPEEIIGEIDKDTLYAHAFNGFMSMELKQQDDNLEYRIGMMYLTGKGVEENREAAIKYLEQAAEARNIYAMNKMAAIYLEENSQDKIPVAVDYLKEAATRGKNSMAMYTLGNVYSSDNYGMKNQDEAIKWYLKAEEIENEFASYKLGKLYLADKQYDIAIEHFEKCDSKYAAYNLGKIYMNESLEQYDFGKGMEHMKQAAEQGNSFAQYRVGKEYYTGEKVNQDLDKAIHWFSEAAKQDNEYATYNLGKIYYEKKEYENAVNEFEKIENENMKPFADYYMGKMYLDKESNLYDVDKGISYLEKSAEGGNSAASVSLAFIYLKGDGVKRNSVLGRGWMERAAEDGNEFASKFLEQMKQNGYYKQSNMRLGKTRAMILSNATQFLKKALKDEWQKRQNEREYEMMMSQGEEKE